MRRNRDHVLANRKSDEVRRGMQSELLHDAVLVKRDGTRGDLKNARRLLHGPSFSKQLDHLALANGKTVRLEVWIANELLLECDHHSRSDIGVPAEHVAHRALKLRG